MPKYNNSDIQKYLVDATEEASRIDSLTRWILIGPARWAVLDEDKHLLGWVNAKICIKSGECTFDYTPDSRTYHNIDPIGSVKVDAPNWEDREEFSKLVEFDQAIIDAHGL